jgi:hypothetical protein
VPDANDEDANNEIAVWDETQKKDMYVLHRELRTDLNYIEKSG